MGQDLVNRTWSSSARNGTPSFKGYSKFDDEKDIRCLATAVDFTGWDSAIQHGVDTDAFVKFLAMETLLKHWDGFSGKINNTFIYNDVTAVTNPGLGDIKFKSIPSGLDQILQEDRDVELGQQPRIVKTLLGTPRLKQQLDYTLLQFANGEVFSEAFTGKTIDRLATVLKRASLSDDKINKSGRIMREQIQQVRTQFQAKAATVDGVNRTPRDLPPGWASIS